ncbi:STAS domain-containing protein [Kitasatospora sp. NPDC127060]
MHTEFSAPFVVRASGDVDLAAAPRLRRDLAHALAAHHDVVLDLSEVEFMDCAGLGALVEALNQADRQGRRLALRGTGPRVARLLELTGLHRRLAARPRTAPSRR